MTFTNQIDTNEKNTCYYRKAYSPEVFKTLSLDEKRSLIAFTVGEFSSDVEVAYAADLGDEIGSLTEQDILMINNAMLLKSNQTYSLELYLFIYNTLMKRFVARKKNFVPVIEEGYIHRRFRKKEYRDRTLDIIILHLLLDELLEMNEVVLVNAEDRKFFLGEIEKNSNRLCQTHEIIDKVRMEIPKEQQEALEMNDVHIGRSR